MYNTATVKEAIVDARSYGFNVTISGEFAWSGIKAKRDAYIRKLNGIYERNLAASKVDVIK